MVITNNELPVRTSQLPTREQSVDEITSLANLVSSIIGYAAENLLVEVSKLTRDQLANESIRPDFGHFRVQIFKYLLKYAHIAEQKSRLLSPLLINIYRYEIPHPYATRFQNLLQSSNINNEECAEDVSVVEEETIATVAESKTQFCKQKDVLAAFKALLTLFSKFHSPKTVFRASELRDIYFELLSSSDFELQSGGLACLLTYKEPFLVPYAKNFQNLMLEKKMNDELVLFSVDVQNCAIDDKHRAELMPYVMNILFGRFHAKSVVRGRMKRQAIFRFLANCKAAELDIFVSLLLDSFTKSFDVKSQGIESTLETAIKKYDPTRTFPLYRIRSVLGIVNDMFLRLAPSLNAVQINLFFDITLVCAVLVNQAFHHVDEMAPKVANQLKALRVFIFDVLIQFCRSFLLHRMKTNRMNCLFTAVLEPMIVSYNAGLSNSGPLLVQLSIAKLFTFWAGFPRYFLLLNYQFSPALKEETPISLLCNTLSHGGTPKAIQNAMIDAIANLLRSRRDDEDYLFEELAYDGLPQKIVPVHKNAEGFGTCILLSQTSKILDFLMEKIPQAAKDKSRIPNSYMEILNRISLFVDDLETGEKFAMTFLAFLGNHRLVRNRERMTELLKTMAVLSKYISDPLYAFRRVVRLLSKLHDRSARDALVGFIMALKSNANFPASAACHMDMLADLEAYDRHRIEEPDLERRFQAFSRIDDLYNREETKGDLSSEIIQLFAHSHAYCIINSSDIALRKTSSNAFRHLIKYVAKRFSTEDAEYLLYSHIVQLTLDGLNSTNEICRTEFVYCLADLIARFPTNVHFAQLQALNPHWRCDDPVHDEDAMDDASQDENNFFENAVHIQAHRRQRAFFRLTEQLRSGEINISANILLRYIFPIFKPYLLETASKISALSDQSIQLFGVILERTPWRKYYQFLESFLRQIDNGEKTKGVVRVLNAIFGAFHFNLKNLPRVDQSVIFSSEKVEETNVVDSNGAKLYDASKSVKVSSHESVTAFGMEKEVEDDEQMDNNEKPADNEEESDDEPMKEDEEHIDVDEGGDASAPSLSEEGKRKILNYMVSKVLPRLRQAMQKTVRNLNDAFGYFHDIFLIWADHNHKKSHQNNFEIDEELLTRAPIVLAVSHFVKQMPDYVLKENLNGLIAALNRLLLSRSNSVRQGARKIMGQFVQILGAEQLPHVIKEMRQTFLKGFQLYVMIFTIHTTISALESDMKPGDLDACFEDVFEICKLELVGDVAEARKNAIAVPEAKSNKSVDTFILLGKYISEKSMGTILQLVKETIDARPNGGVIKKFSELLRGFSTGLHNNASINSNVLIEFILGVLQRYLNEVLAQQEQMKFAESLEKQMQKKGHRPPSCLLLPPEPKRIGELVKHSLKSKVTIFVEFSLQLLADVLKARPIVRELDAKASDDFQDFPVFSIDESSQALLEQLNKFVTPIIDCLKLKLVKVISLSLRCLSILLRFKLSNIQSNIQAIMDRLFVILSEYVGIGQNNTTVTELNQLLFKCFTQLIRGFPILSMTPRRVEILLNYAESDLLDSQKQATSFTLIKAIVRRKVEDEKIDNLIQYLSELLVTTTSPTIGTQCRQVVLIYLTSHPSGSKTLDHWLEFFANQTEYELEAGRLSALEMLNSIVVSCSKESVNRLSLFVFMKLSSLLVNDESENCRQYASLVLQNLLSTVDESSFNDLFSVTKDWLKSKKSAVQLLALKVFRDFVMAHGKCSSKNIANVNAKLYEVADTLVGNIASTGIALFDDWSEAVIVASFNYLTAFGDCNPPKLAEILHNQAETLLAVLNNALRCISSTAIQISSSNFLGRLLTLPSLNNFDSTKTLSLYFPRSLSGVCLTVCSQIRHLKFHMQTLADQATKNLSILMSRLNAVDFGNVCTRLAGICWGEITKDSDSMIKRENVFKVTAACVIRADEDRLQSLYKTLLPLLYREMNRKSVKHTEELCQIANDVVAVFRSKIGEKKLSEQMVKCQKDAFKKQKERREKLKARAVIDPAAEAFSKQKRHERKRAAKRRKLDEVRPHRIMKRRRKEMTIE